MDTSISAILPTHNRAHLLNRAICSVLDQLEDRDELIVVDDGSTDNTGEVISEYGSRIKYVKTPGLGAGAARNIGVKNAKNALVTFIDSDDEWRAGKTIIQRAFMAARPDVLFSFTNFCTDDTFKPNGIVKHFNSKGWSRDTRSWSEILGTGSHISSVVKLPHGKEDFLFHVGSMCLHELLANYINVNTLMVLREEAGDALHFAEDTPTYEDWECFGRLACAGAAAYLDFESACQYGHAGPRLTDAHITECAQARVTILPRVWGANKEFLSKHHELYRRVLDEERRTLIDGLLVRGETARARVELLKIEGRTSVLRNLLAVLPGSMTKTLFSLRRAMKSS